MRQAKYFVKSKEEKISLIFNNTHEYEGNREKKGEKEYMYSLSSMITLTEFRKVLPELYQAIIRPFPRSGAPQHNHDRAEIIAELAFVVFIDWIGSCSSQQKS